MNKVRQWFTRPAVRHLASILVSVVVSTGLISQGIVNEATAQAIGTALGNIVGGT